MYLSIRQKLTASSIGLLFAIGVLHLFPYWLALVAFGAMIPFFTRVLAA
ncbi:hypothetical protein [Halosolutus gelatinilyticus]|nr:hypothetical protein [Halosolutus gelatinilyticus]